MLITDTPGGALLPLRESPRLTISQGPAGFTLSWPADTGDWQLQESQTPDSGWATVAATPVLANGSQTITVTAGPGARCYRLWGAQTAALTSVPPTRSDKAIGMAPKHSKSLSGSATDKGISW